MKDRYDLALESLKLSNNFRTIKTPYDITPSKGLIDLTSNDYLGIAANKSLSDRFFESYFDYEMTSSASRLLTLRQSAYFDLENLLSSLYKRDVILFNSGYHANVGTISALGGKGVLIVADRLVHASIIDGIVLSRSQFIRFRHNDCNHLLEILEKEHSNYENIIIVTESIFSMDGDMCDIHKIVDIKNRYDNTLLYIDEAHAFGVYGKYGLGLSFDSELMTSVDFMIGTFGKAGASIGAFVATSSKFKEYIINSARSLIFSTVIPPINCAWSKFVVEKIIDMDYERQNLSAISSKLHDFINPLNIDVKSCSQIVPLVVGSSEKAISLSEQLKNLGYIALPIRTPTVPKGTERVRISLCAAIGEEIIDKFINDLKTLI